MTIIRLKSAAARNFFASLAVANDGAKALENTCGPMRDAIQAELDRRNPIPHKPICISCGATPDDAGALPCGH